MKPVNRKNTLGEKDPKREIPKSILEKKVLYKNNFKLIVTENLYSGPFVLIDNQKLFLGMFLYSVHSDELPIFEFWRTNEENKIFQSVENWIIEVKKLTPKTHGK